MPSNPPIVTDLVAEILERCAPHLATSGQVLLDAQGSPSVVLRGLRKGFEACCYTTAAPMAIQDQDVATLTRAALERVLDEAELFSLQRVLSLWHMATMKHQEAMSSAVVASGWLVDARRGVKDRVSELKATCGVPFREPTDTVVVSNSRWPFAGECPDGVIPVGPCYPSGPGGFP